MAFILINNTNKMIKSNKETEGQLAKRNFIIGIIILIALIALVVLFGCEKPTLPSEGITDIDNNMYHTVVIGEQTWFKENLKTTRLNNGTDIEYVSYLIDWRALNTPAYCYYDNDKDTYKDTFGALYNWSSVTTNKLCPTGWHVPSYNDWNILFTYLGGTNKAGGILKSTDFWEFPNIGATDSMGFTALPGGFRDYTGDYNNINIVGFWWTSTEYVMYFPNGNISESAYNIILHRSSNSIFGLPYVDYPYNKHAGMSIRCLKD